MVSQKARRELLTKLFGDEDQVETTIKYLNRRLHKECFESRILRSKGITVNPRGLPKDWTIYYEKLAEREFQGYVYESQLELVYELIRSAPLLQPVVFSVGNRILECKLLHGTDKEHTVKFYFV